MPGKLKGDVTGLPFVCEAKSYAVGSFRPHKAAEWVAKVNQEARAGRFPFGLVALDLGGSRDFGSCYWLASVTSVSRAMASLPELVPAETVSFSKALAGSVFVLVNHDSHASASLKRAHENYPTVSRKETAIALSDRGWEAC